MTRFYAGGRRLLPLAQFQWHPTLTSHDPITIITLESPPPPAGGTIPPLMMFYRRRRA